MLNDIGKAIRGNLKPFGGIQVILSGDFFQLPPIGRNEETSKEKFAFMSQAWLDAQFNICYITEQHRQQKDDLNVLLNEIRKGEDFTNLEGT